MFVIYTARQEGWFGVKLIFRESRNATQHLFIGDLFFAVQSLYAPGSPFFLSHCGVVHSSPSLHIL